MKRVAITGIGVIAPGSIGKNRLWDNMINGKVYTQKVKQFDCKDLRIQIAGEVENFEKEKFLKDRSKIKINNLRRVESLGLSALSMAIEDSGLSLDCFEGILLAIGMTMTNMMSPTLAEYLMEKQFLQNRSKANLEEVSSISPVSLASLMCQYFNLNRPIVRVFTNACAASNYSIAWGYDNIRAGRSEIALVGGVEALSLGAMLGFNRLLSLTPDFCRPFSKNRRGIVVSEGAAFLVLEELKRAQARNAHIYGEIRGCGFGVDAYHITSPRSDASGIIDSIQNALKASKIQPSEIDYVCAHGTGTPLNDKTEVKALKAVFGDNVPPTSSIKSMIGHTLGAAGAIGAVCSLLMMEKGEAMPTVNFEQKDDECDIDCIPNRSRKMKINTVISNAFAFGGNNSCVVFSKMV